LAGASLAIKAGAGLQVTSAEAAVLVAAFGCGDYGQRWLRTAARAGAAVSVVIAVVLVLVNPGYHRSLAIFPALLAAALGVGEAASTRRDAVAAEVRHAQDAERARIARELHDVIAHQLSAIAVQAGSARMAASSQPTAPAEAVATIEQVARDALNELNHLVGMLRREPDDRLDRAPQPSVSDLPGLVERARGVGLPVTLSNRGEATALPTAVDLAVYRIVQEGLTNAIRYAERAATRVQLCYAPNCVIVSVEDDGPGAGTNFAPRGGRGLAGLHERVELLHGSLEVGEAHGGGYRLVARIPTSEA
jgi:signal transduction histidine kinase